MRKNISDDWLQPASRNGESERNEQPGSLLKKDEKSKRRPRGRGRGLGGERGAIPSEPSKMRLQLLEQGQQPPSYLFHLDHQLRDPRTGGRHRYSLQLDHQPRLHKVGLIYLKRKSQTNQMLSIYLMLVILRLFFPFRRW